MVLYWILLTSLHGVTSRTTRMNKKITVDTSDLTNLQLMMMCCQSYKGVFWVTFLPFVWCILMCWMFSLLCRCVYLTSVLYWDCIIQFFRALMMVFCIPKLASLSLYIYIYFFLNLSCHGLESKTFWNLALLLYWGAGMNITGRPVEWYCLLNLIVYFDVLLFHICCL